MNANDRPLNAVEKKFMRELMRGQGRVSSFVRTPSHIRRLMKETAYHEAAHVAAQAFTGLEWSHIVRVSIIPNETTRGRVTTEGNFAEMRLASNRPPQKHTLGRILLLQRLAGRGAAARLDGAGDGDPIVDWDSDEWFEEGTDLHRANRTAEIMSRPYLPAGRLLVLAEGWTIEMLEIPAVWNVVSKLANLLLERGIIEDPGLLHSTCEKILDLSRRLPKWKRRLHVQTRPRR